MIHESSRYRIFTLQNYRFFVVCCGKLLMINFKITLSTSIVNVLLRRTLLKNCSKHLFMLFINRLCTCKSLKLILCFPKTTQNIFLFQCVSEIFFSYELNSMYLMNLQISSCNKFYLIEMDENIIST